MSSFEQNERSIDGVNSVSDYRRRILGNDELEEVAHFKLLHDWWKQKNEEKQHIPSRKDFNPAAFQKILPNIAILDLIYNGNEVTDFATALIGTGLTGVYGEHTGGLVSAFDNEYVVQTIFDAGGECIQRREPLGITSKAISEKLPFLRSFALYCPLATDHVHIDKLLIHISFEKSVSSLTL